MKKTWLKYHTYHPEIKVFFCYGKGSKLGSDPWDLCYEDLTESHVGAFKKVLRAMEHIDLNYTCDFFIRTNLSTFWDLDLLYERLKELPTKGCFCATKSNWPKINGGVFAMGFDMVVNGDSLTEIVKRKQEILSIIDHPLVLTLGEDQILSTYFTDVLKLEIIKSNKWCCYLDRFDKDVERMKREIDLAKERKQDHFRVKSNRELNERIGIDDEIYRYLCHKYYKKELNFWIKTKETTD